MKLLNEASYADNGFKKSVGFTKITNKNGKLIISHSGNMGNSVKDSVNPNLKIAGLPTIEQLKKKYPSYKEEGSPDYSYTITFNIPKNESVVTEAADDVVMKLTKQVDVLTKRLKALESKFSIMEREVNKIGRTTSWDDVPHTSYRNTDDSH
jgi:hypothetical protein